ncbi:MAG: pantoate kinase [Promethearchaeota archaeon]
MNTKKLVIEIPHRISGFFEIFDEENGIKILDPEKIGSRGAGFNLSAMGRTSVIVRELQNDEDFQFKVSINGESFDKKAETTFFILNQIKKYLKKSYKVEIQHEFDLPVGCGYGASGSGALGTIFALNKILNLNLSLIERGRIAHIAEVVNRTGLGTVCGQLGGGLCVLREPGYPCFFETIPIPKDIAVICGSFGMIHTKSILTSDLSIKIKEAGREALSKLLQDPNIKTFIKASYEFVEKTKMLDILYLTKTKELIYDLNKLNIIGASMNQLGRSVYALCREREIQKVIEIFESYKPKIKIFSLKIDEQKLK